MNIINLSGGLGNQLFQYAFGKYIEKNTKSDVKFDVNTDLVAKKITKRNLDIEKFKIELPIANSKEIKLFKKFETGLLWRIERKLAQKRLILFDNYIVQQNAHSVLTKLRENSYYDGYWQCYKYVDSVREILLNRIKVSEVFYENYRSLLNEFESFDSVAIHIRRGDYINIKVNAKLFEVCDMDYYDKAIKLIKSTHPNAKFYIFTQDLEWAKENFSLDKFKIVEGNSAIDDMMLMSFCKHNIIANSTFSWWSAWLNRNPNKLIISPLKWYKGKMNIQTINLIPTNWIRI